MYMFNIIILGRGTCRNKSKEINPTRKHLKSSGSIEIEVCAALSTTPVRKINIKSWKFVACAVCQYL